MTRALTPRGIRTGTCPTCGAQPGELCRTASGATCRTHPPRLGKKRKTLEQRFWECVNLDPASTCWLWTGDQYVTGYGRFTIKGRSVRAHRVSWEMANGRSVPDGLFILHSCDTPLCVNPAHLRPGTHEENMRDMSLRARTVGEKSSTAKLTAAQVQEIKSAHAAGSSQASLGRKYGVSPSTINLIVKGKRWQRGLDGAA